MAEKKSDDFKPKKKIKKANQNQKAEKKSPNSFKNSRENSRIDGKKIYVFNRFLLATHSHIW